MNRTVHIVSVWGATYNDSDYDLVPERQLTWAFLDEESAEQARRDHAERSAHNWTHELLNVSRAHYPRLADALYDACAVHSFEVVDDDPSSVTQVTVVAAPVVKHDDDDDGYYFGYGRRVIGVAASPQAAAAMVRDTVAELRRHLGDASPFYTDEAPVTELVDAVRCFPCDLRTGVVFDPGEDD